MKWTVLATFVLLAACSSNPVGPGELECDAVVYAEDSQVPDSVKFYNCREDQS